ncbi:MAG: hypothetical protein QXR39_09325 [Candidatus Methanomethylicia archaeon]
MNNVNWIIGIIVAVIAVAIGLALLPVVFNFTAQAVNSTSNTTYQTLINIVPLVIIAGIVLAVVYMFVTKE